MQQNLRSTVIECSLPDVLKGVDMAECDVSQSVLKSLDNIARCVCDVAHPREIETSLLNALDARNWHPTTIPILRDCCAISHLEEALSYCSVEVDNED